MVNIDKYISINNSNLGRQFYDMLICCVFL